MGFPGDSDGKESACNAGDLGSIPGSGRFPWSREWLPTPLFLSGEGQSGGLQSLGPQSQTRPSGHTWCLYSVNISLPQLSSLTGSAPSLQVQRPLPLLRMVTEAEALFLPAGKIQSGPWMSRCLACGSEGCGGGKGYRVTASPRSHPVCLVPLLGFDPDFVCVHSFAVQVRLSVKSTACLSSSVPSLEGISCPLYL